MTTVPPIGIDLGTSHSRVGIFKNGKAEIIANRFGSRATPSLVAFEKNNILVGNGAKGALAENPKSTIYGAKRLLSRASVASLQKLGSKYWPFEVVSNEETGKPIKVRVTCNGQTKSLIPENIVTQILKNLKETAESRHSWTTVVDAVITVPTNFTMLQRQAMVNAAKEAGLNVIRVLNEATAAGIAYCMEKGFVGKKRGRDAKNVLIFNLGGGHADVTIFTLDNDGILEVMSSAGDMDVGGENFVNEMVDHFVKEFERQHNYQKNISSNQVSMSRLRAACEKAKRELSETNQVPIFIADLLDGVGFNTTITRAHFEELNAEWFRLSLGIVEKALRDANMEKSDLHDIVLVGGASRTPKIQQLLKDFFNGRELTCSRVNEVVCQGAAIQAGLLHSKLYENVPDFLVLNATSNSLGIKMENDDTVTTIIKRNTTIPAEMTQTFTTYKDHQTSMVIKVYEGEKLLARDCQFLGRLICNGIANAPRGARQIEVTFAIDANSNLTVIAVEKETGRKEKLVITVCEDNRPIPKSPVRKLKDEEVDISNDDDSSSVIE